MNSTQKNFILIELLLVVAIIVVLISILFPAQGKAREKIASGFYGLSPHLHGEQKSPQMVRNASRVVSPSIAPPFRRTAVKGVPAGRRTFPICAIWPSSTAVK